MILVSEDNSDPWRHLKPNTDDIRDAPSLEIIPALQNLGANIKAYDPEGVNEGKQIPSS